jgi:carbon monoxide dehydrogenase subunit G
MGNCSDAAGTARTKRATLARLIAMVCLGGASWAMPCIDTICAAEIGRVAVSNNGDTYRISFDAAVRAPPHLVYQQLSDYAHLNRLSPVITGITVDPSPDGKSDRVRSRLRSCILFFCREIAQVEDVTEPDRHTIIAHMVPGLGDFIDGDCTWRIVDDGEWTRLHYEATRTIAFWVPRIIGPWLIKHTMREHLESSVAALEEMASQAAGSRR